ncbi:MAG TPA: hypothetical protein P5076_20190, partial [Myxococcota bacterium]|nr:hypothetical protein [Myxococcota bacterium]
MFSCEGCGQDIPEQAVHCPYCGAQCGDGPADPSSIFTQPRKGLLCPGCGQRTLQEGDYCMWCGFRLDSLAETTDGGGTPALDQVTEVQGRVLDGTHKARPAGGGNTKAVLVAVILGLSIALVVVLLMLLAAQRSLASLTAQASAQAEAQDDLGPAEARYLEAMDYTEQGRWEDAAVMLRAALLADPRHAAARAKLEEVELQAQVAGNARLAKDDLEAKDFDGALQAVNRLPPDALEKDPELLKLRARVRDEYRKHHLSEASLAELQRLADTAGIE